MIPDKGLQDRPTSTDRTAAESGYAMRRRLAAAALGCGIVLTACSGGDEPADPAAGQSPGAAATTAAAPDPAPPTSPSASATGDAGGAGTISGEDLTDRVVSAANSDGSAAGEFTIDAGGQSIEGEADFTLDPYAIDATFAGLPGLGPDGIRVVLDGETAYLDLGGSVPLPDDKRWVSISENDKGPAAAAFKPVLEDLTQGFDPRESFRIIEAAPTWTAEGSEELDGVQTTRYVGVADVDRLIELSDGAEADSARQLAAQGVTEIPLTVWLEDNDLLRRIDFTADSAAGALSTQTTYDWSAEVDVSPPPANEVISASDLSP